MRTCLFVPHRAAPTRIHCPAPPPCNRACQFRSRLTLAEARVRGRSPAQKKELRHPWLRTSGAILHDRRSAPQGGLNVRQAAVVSFSCSGSHNHPNQSAQRFRPSGCRCWNAFRLFVRNVFSNSPFDKRPSLASAGGALRAAGSLTRILARGRRSTALN